MNWLIYPPTQESPQISFVDYVILILIIIKLEILLTLDQTI